MQLSKISKNMLRQLIKFYIQHNVLEIDVDSFNSIYISAMKYPHKDVHTVSIYLRELVSLKLIEARFNEINDECNYIKLTDKGLSYFHDRKFEILKNLFFPIIVSIFTSLLTTIITLLISN